MFVITSVSYVFSALGVEGVVSCDMPLFLAMITLFALMRPEIFKVVDFCRHCLILILGSSIQSNFEYDEIRHSRTIVEARRANYICCDCELTSESWLKTCFISSSETK